MARVFIPAAWREVTGVAELVVAGGTLREIVAALAARFPELGERLVEDDRLADGLAVSIDGILAARGLLTAVSPESEVHFLPAISGG